MAQTVNEWLGKNIKWVLTLLVLSISNYYLLANKIDGNSRAIIVNANEISIIKTREIAQLTEEVTNLQNNNNNDTDIMKEIKFNLKRLMDSQHVPYIEDTNKNPRH